MLWWCCSAVVFMLLVQVKVVGGIGRVGGVTQPVGNQTEG